MFHTRGPAAAKDRSPSDDVVRGTATELDAADLRPGLTIAPDELSRGRLVRLQCECDGDGVYGIRLTIA